MQTLIVTYHYFLGLRTLTVIQDAAHMCGLSEEDMLKIDFNDPKVLGMISEGKTEGVFQLESAGMKQFMTELKPEKLEDVIAGISLYRPGPMDFIPKYISGKNNQDSIQYDCPQLEPILKPTYGCIVYQEQVMQIVRSLAGYSFGRSDLVRRAMAKKKAKVMEAERQNFVYGNKEENVKGCIANGIPEQVANKIYNDMIDFAKYAFNKSHAAAYAVVSYQTAWLKYYHPVEFMAALLTSVRDNGSKIVNYTMSCRKMGIDILPPDVNEAVSGFSAVEGKIRYGMSAIKGVGEAVIEAIVNEREKHGKYQSMQDFMMRLTSKEVKKQTIENFIKAGAFDCFQAKRRQLMMVYPMVLDNVNREKKDSMSGQLSLFDLGGEELAAMKNVPLPKVGEYEKEELLNYEKEVLGIYISGHPLEEYVNLIQKNCTANSQDFVLDTEEDYTEGAKVRDGDRVTIGGMITEKTVKTTKNNTLMAFLTLEDLYGTVEIIVFSKVYERKKEMLRVDEKVFVTGRVDADEKRNAKLICQEIISFSDIPCELWLQFPNKESFNENEQKLYELLAPSDGKDDVYIYLKQEKQIRKLSRKYSVNARMVIAEHLLDTLEGVEIAIKEKKLTVR